MIVNHKIKIIIYIYHQLLAPGASTPYKRWSKCTMKKIGGEGFCRNLGGKCVNYSCTPPLSFCNKFPLQNYKSFILALVSLIMYWLSMYMKYRFIIQK